MEIVLAIVSAGIIAGLIINRANPDQPPRAYALLKGYGESHE